MKITLWLRRIEAKAKHLRDLAACVTYVLYILGLLGLFLCTICVLLVYSLFVGTAVKADPFRATKSY